MMGLIYEYITLFGLDYQPTTFPDLFVWLVLVMCAMSMVCGIIRVMFGMCLMSIKGGLRK